MRLNLNSTLRIVRILMANGLSLNDAISNTIVSEALRDEVRLIILREDTIPIRPVRLLSENTGTNWLSEIDRSNWYYWPQLRDYLLNERGRSLNIVRSLDDATDRILGQMADPSPSSESFDVRGLVLGHVQSGKTANFSALIAKAVDSGYRLIIVLSGIHNSLRRQTQIRLLKELVGYPGGVPVPPTNLSWITVTTDDLVGGDFNPGTVNFSAILQSSLPVLAVVKKWGSVLTRINEQLAELPEEVRATLPILVIDDEADQASINTGGNRVPNITNEYDEEEPEDNYNEDTPPSVINGLIRQLLDKFDRSAYVGYTATPFANILIDSNAIDQQAGEDLYPRDFFVDLPKPTGYFGPEEIFGSLDPETGEDSSGIDIIRNIPDNELQFLIPPRRRRGEINTFVPTIPPSLERAILDFVLAGAARRQRGNGSMPAAMLIHTSLKTIIQQQLTTLIEERLNAMSDEWSNARSNGIQARLETRWDEEFRPIIRDLQPTRDMPFSELIDHIGPFFERIEVRQINSGSEDLLDYEREPELKAIVVGGNRLSRGLTVEGLLISYYVRRSPAYDTLMQMGRWFGYREGYEDLTRIFTTTELEGWFRDLAGAEIQLRRDLQIYENTNLTPRELGMRIRRHPAMLVTSRLKMKYARSITVDQSYSGQLVQTTTFPLSDMEFLEDNLSSTRSFIAQIGTPDSISGGRIIWSGVSASDVLDFLSDYRIDVENRTISPALLRSYIERQMAQRELERWTIAIVGLQSTNPILGTIDLGTEETSSINAIERTQLRSRNGSLGVITEPLHEAIGLTPSQITQAEAMRQGRTEIGIGASLRSNRPVTEGLLLIYPISRNSGYSGRSNINRRPIFPEQNQNQGVDIIGLAISFPLSETATAVQGEYIFGTVDWRPI